MPVKIEEGVPFTYSITQGGTMDGKMCTTLPGVWEPYEQTWESNRSIRMENVGTSNIINPWLKIGPIDFYSQQTMADSVVKGLSTDREKALAIFYFYITHRYHKGNGDNTAQGDVSQAINVFGFNTCGNSTLCISDLLDKVGMRDCIFSHCPGHVVPQVFFDGKYNTLDGDMAGGTGTILWHMKAPYQFVGGALSASGDGVHCERYQRHRRRISDRKLP